jgi:uncharacterized protein YjdB
MKKAHYLVIAALALFSWSCCKKNVAVQSVTVSPSSISLTEGDTQTLTATVTPANAMDGTVVWSSSNTQVATVSAGTVTALKPGAATITATAGDKKGTCSVTVLAKVFPVTGVTLDITGKELAEGETVTLKATVSPDNATNKNVSWSSSNNAVATVGQNGKVTAVAKGTATITVTTADGNKTATCKVTVIAKVASVSLNKSALTLNIGDEETLIATITPSNADDQAVSWSSSNNAVAAVDQNGKVKAVAKGTATITVTTADGNKTATCEVTVIAKVASVSLNKPALTLNVGDEETLIATITPSNADDQAVSWSSDKPDVATVDQNGKVKALKAGKAIVTVTTHDGGKTATCEVTVQGGEGGTEGYGNGGEYGEGQF